MSLSTDRNHFNATFDPRPAAEILAGLGLSGENLVVADRSFLDRPGPQSHNRHVRGTLAEQLDLAYGPRPVNPIPPRAAERVLAGLADLPDTRAALLGLLASDIAAIAAEAVRCAQSQQASRPRKTA